MKLGFAINYASEGLTTALVCNKGQWTNKVIDIREYLKMFSGLAIQSQSHQESTGNKLTFLSFDENGCMLTIAKAISGRWDDFLACWIYIPNSVVIDGEQIVHICHFASSIIDESNITSREEEIKKFFSQSYPSKDKYVKNAPSYGNKFGVRFIDEQSLIDILGDNRYQPYYSAYRAIFLLSHSEEVKPIVSSFEDLTTQPMLTYKVIEAPNVEELSILGKNTELYFETGERFDRDIILLENTKLQLIARRPGFVDIHLDPIPVTEWNKKVLFSQALNWKIKLTDSMFKVRNSDGKTLVDIQIRVDGHSLLNGFIISELKARDIVYTITAPGYEEFSGHVNLSQGARDIEVTLYPEVRTETHHIVLRDDSVAEITLKAREMKFSMDKFPLKGYSYDSGRKAFCLDWGFIFKQRLIGVLYVIVIAICFVLYFTFDAWWDNHEFGGSFPWIHEKPKPEVILEEDTLANYSELTHSDSLAIRYLDNNDVWSKDSLESYNLTEGIYDDMNAFCIDDFSEKYSKVVNASKNMWKVSNAMKKSCEEGIDPVNGKEQNEGKYNQNNDTEIKVLEYINWITTDHRLSTENSSISPEVAGSETEVGTSKTQGRINAGSKSKKQISASKVSKDKKQSVQKQHLTVGSTTQNPQRGGTKKDENNK